VKVVARTDRTHNPFDESHWVSRLRENLMSGSDGEGLETERWQTLAGHEEGNLGNRQGQACPTPPRQSLTRQIFFRILKSGCRVEELQLEKLQRLEPALAFYMIIAWRVLFLTMLGRECPEMPCDVVFDEAEWQAVYLVTQRQPPPDTPPSLECMVRMIATLGGFLDRKCDGFPGPQTLWIGLQRAADFVLALEAQRSIAAERYG
jgi:hypothetical protein